MRGFKPIPADEDDEALLFESEQSFVQRPGQSDSANQALLILLFVVTTGIALLAGVFLERHILPDKDALCTAHVSHSSEYIPAMTVRR